MNLRSILQGHEGRSTAHLNLLNSTRGEKSQHLRTGRAVGEITNVHIPITEGGRANSATGTIATPSTASAATLSATSGAIRGGRSSSSSWWGVGDDRLRL